MINANELRIGNIVAIKDQEKYIVGEPNEYAVTDIGDRVGLVNRGKQQWAIEEINPIPITSEWLLKFGFAQINHIHDGEIFKKDWLRVSSDVFAWEWRGGYIKNAPRYIHQLQNLYFALTGEELTIK